MAHIALSLTILLVGVCHVHSTKYHGDFAVPIPETNKAAHVHAQTGEGGGVGGNLYQKPEGAPNTYAGNVGFIKDLDAEKRASDAALAAALGAQQYSQYPQYPQQLHHYYDQGTKA